RTSAEDDTVYGAGNDHNGLRIESGTITTGSGALNVEGYGGNSSSSTNHGIYIASINSRIQSTSGIVNILGHAGISTGLARGVYLENGGQILTSTGALTVTGYGGPGTGDTNIGIY